MKFREEQDKFNAGKAANKHVINHWMDGHDRKSKVDKDGNGYIFLNDIDKVIEIATNKFKSHQDNSHAFRLIAFKNDTIDLLNEVTRNIIFEYDTIEQLNQFEPGELVIARGGYGPNGEIYNNQIFNVVDAVECNGPHDVPCLALRLYPSPPLEINVFVVDQVKGKEIYQRKLDKIVNAAKQSPSRWRDVILFKEKFAQFDYSYALNSHKAQGRTFNEVVVFEHEILNIRKTSLKAKLQAMYVACTRAKQRVYIYNKNYRVDQSKLPNFVIEELNI